MTNQSKVEVTCQVGTAFQDPAAIELYQAAMLKTALKLFIKTRLCIIRGGTGPKMLVAISRILKKEYTGRDKYEAALADLEAYLAKAKANMLGEQQK